MQAVSLSLESGRIAGADAFVKSEGRTEILRSQVWRSRRGLRAGHVCDKGFQGTWEILPSPPGKWGWGVRSNKPRPAPETSTRVYGAKKVEGRWYPNARVYGKGRQVSECLIVPGKWGTRTLRDPMEGRRHREMESLEGKMIETLGSEPIATRLQRIAELARKSPEMVITTLAHHIDKEWFKKAYRRTRKSGAAGVDEQTAEEYGKELDKNLEDLLERFKPGRCRAPDVKLSYIPKADGKKRPIGIPTFEDKVLQRAVAMVLEAVYEQDFYDCSYGFRPGKSAYQVVQALWKALMRNNGGIVVEIDIQEFFDTLDRNHLEAFLDKRVRDGIIRRTIGKWMRAGVMEEGRVHRPEKGTPQGGVISPLLANIYLHEVLDRWFMEVVKPRMKGKAELFRYADDAVMLFTNENDAQRVMRVQAKRFDKYGLTLHPTKTRVVIFRKPGKDEDGGRRPGTFSFLGFTHYWGKTKRKG